MYGGGGAECVGIAYSMWGKEWSRWDWVECVGLLGRCVIFLCSAWVVIYYAASLLLKLGFCVLPSCVILCLL